MNPWNRENPTVYMWSSLKKGHVRFDGSFSERFFGMNDFMASCDGFPQKVNIVQFGNPPPIFRTALRQANPGEIFLRNSPRYCRCSMLFLPKKAQGPVGIPHRRHTLLKINMEHNHGGLEDHFPFPKWVS